MTSPAPQISSQLQGTLTSKILSLLPLEDKTIYIQENQLTCIRGQIFESEIENGVSVIDCDWVNIGSMDVIFTLDAERCDFFFDGNFFWFFLAFFGFF